MMRASYLMVAMLIASSTARADPAAEALFKEGQQLLADNNHAEACPRLEAGLRIDPAMQPLRDELYRCYTQLARVQLVANQDPLKVCDRIETIEKAQGSEANKLALQYCYKATAEALMTSEPPRYDTACPQAERSVRVAPTSKNKAFVGECYRRWGKLGRAHRILVDGIGTARSEGDSAMEEQIRMMLAISALQPGRVIVAIPVREATATIDGEPITAHGLALDGAPPANDALGTPGFAVDPGKHNIKVTAANKPAVERDVTVVNGATETVVIEWPAVTPTPPTPPVIAPHSSRKKIGWIAIAAGGAVGAAGLYFGYDALTKQNDADELCPTGTGCSDAAIDLNDKANRSANISNVLVGVGLVGAAVGTYLVLTAPKETRVTPSVGPGGAGVTLTRRF